MRKVLTLLVPWDRDLEASDLIPAGSICLTRDVQLLGQAQRHLALPVRGSSGVTLGLLALRCARHGEKLAPLTVSIPD